MENYISPDKNIVIKYNWFPHFIGAFPPFYSKSLNTFLIPEKGIRSYILPLVFFIMSLDNIYLWMMVYPVISSQTLEPQEFINFYNHIISRSFGAILAWIFYFQMHDLIYLTNVIFQAEKYFESKFLLTMVPIDV